MSEAAEGHAAGDVVELCIDSLAAGGDGVGRTAEGRVVFVPFTAPGDRVRARLEQVRPRFAHARLVERIEDAPSRVEPQCEVYGECGGCAWQHLSYDAQCDAKRKIVEDTLVRVGRLTLPASPKLQPSPQAYGYRSRVRVLAGPEGVGYRRRSSHDLCALRRCPIAAAEVESGLAALDSDRPKRRGEWEIALGADGVRAHALAEPGPPLELEVDGRRLRISSGVFYQPNGGLHAALVDALGEAAGSGARALELYAGAGFFTLRLARAFETLLAVESEPAAVADLRHNLVANGVEGVEVVAARVEDALSSERVESLRAEVVVLDPPRRGLPRGAAERIARLGAARIVYLSCDPATLARDLAALCERGYALEEVRAFDLFPQTPHVEVLARLRACREPATLGTTAG